MCVDVVGAKGWIEVAEVNLDKKKQLLEAKYFFRSVCLFFFLFFGARMVFYYGRIEGKNAQDAKV
jgi:hypothetical protein